MKKGQWFLKFGINITGENSVGDAVDIDEEISIPLYAKDQADVEGQLQRVIEMVKEAAEEINLEFFQMHCESIGDEDGLTFSDFRLVCEGGEEKYEKKLDIQIPRLVGGP